MLKSTFKICSVSTTSNFSNKLIKNNFYYALVYVFNRVSQSRIKEVGPDRACAEWLMRNGALIKWMGNKNFVTSYDSIVSENTYTSGVYKLKEVDAVDAGISHHGFPHFQGCNYVDSIRMVDCAYIDDKAFKLLSILSKSLTFLEVNECSEVTDEGLRSLSKLVNLKTLKIGHFENAKNTDIVVEELKKSLPNTEITRVPPGN